MAIKEKVDNLTIDDIAEETSLQVYVLNNSGKILSAANDIVFSVMVGTNREQLVKIPVTFIPVNLAAQVPKKALLDSSEFLRLLNTRMLKLVRSESAQHLLATDQEVIAEEKRLRNVDLKINKEEEVDEETARINKLKDVRILVQNIVEDEDASIEEKRLRLKTVNNLNASERVYIEETLNPT